MKEYPIIFSPPMIRALRHKTVTRRLDQTWIARARKGNRLWVKEGWRPVLANRGVTVTYFADGDTRFFGWSAIPSNWNIPKAAAKGQVTCLFMPRWASRILLECEEDARPEPLQDITDEEAIAEGVERVFSEPAVWKDYELGDGTWTYSARSSFATLWSTLHAKPGERWAENPTIVRVGRFRLISP